MSTPDQNFNLIRALAAKKESGKQPPARDSTPRRPRRGRVFGWTLLVLLLLSATAFGLWRLRGWRGFPFAAKDDAAGAVVADGGTDEAAGRASAAAKDVGPDTAATREGPKPGPVIVQEPVVDGVADFLAGLGEEEAKEGKAQPTVTAMAGERKAKSLASVDESCRDAVAAYLFPSGDEIFDLFRVVRGSDHVRGNAAYRDAVANTKFNYDESNESIDAFAGRDDEDGGNGAFLVVPSGLVRLSRVIGAVMASGSPAGADAKARLEKLTGKVARNGGRISPTVAMEMLSECGVAQERFLDESFVREARAISNGIGMSVIAHATGHIALGHIRKTLGMNAEKARAREGEADSFALAVLGEGNVRASEAVSRQLFVGNIYLMAALAARDEMDVASIARKRRATSPDEIAAIRAQITLERPHPYVGERLADQLANNESLFRQYGIDPAELASIIRALETR